jgi:hypothetical protein
VTLDRPPKILELRQVGTTVRVLWAQGGDDDGTLHADVDSYTLERKIGAGSWTTVDSWDEDVEALQTQHVDDVSGLFEWSPAPFFSYRVTATTEDSVTTTSNTVALGLKRMWLEEALDAKARIEWIPSSAPVGYPVHLGYIVQIKDSGGSWDDITASSPPLHQDTWYIDPSTPTGSSQYRVRSVYKQADPDTGTTTIDTALQQINIPVTCEGQDEIPFDLEVVEITDVNSNGPDGADIKAALDVCATKTYTTPSAVTGGCILRAEPVTYENVAVRITDQANCTTIGVTYPLQCVTQDFPAGLVIEGHGAKTVFRSPLWASLVTPPTAIPLPAPVFEIHRQQSRVTFRNLVLDGRKFEQTPPASGAWWYGALYVWMSNPWNDDLEEIPGDFIGDDDGTCENEVCVEDTSGNDGDGVCEPGEDCVEDPLASTASQDGNSDCNTDYWTTAPGCRTTKETNDGCIHNVEMRDVPGAHGMLLTNAKGWIIEDSEFHDMGCVNRGFGFDCPLFATASDLNAIEGFKTFGIGLTVSGFVEDLKVRRNQVYRVTKYGLAFDSHKNSCNGLTRNHEVVNNLVYDAGGVGIYNHGSVGARIDTNLVLRTRSWDPPISLNSSGNPYAMYIGGYCSDDNEFTWNTVYDSGASAIVWHGTPETVECNGSSCAPLTAVGNTISNNTIGSTCMDKVTAPGVLPVSDTYNHGSFHFGWGAAGTMHMENNALTGSHCRYAISADPQPASIGPLDLRIAGGSYESGPNAATAAQDSPRCGAVYATGSNRKIVIDDDVTFLNEDTDAIPKACIQNLAELVIDDSDADPFDAGSTSVDFASPVNVSGSGILVECDNKPDPCGWICQWFYDDCDY